MQTPAFTSFLPLTVRKPPHAGAPRISLSRRSLYYACQSQESKPVRSEPAPLERRDAMPTLFRGPEAVLGIVIAAAALLADFSRSLARLITRQRPSLKSAHDLDESIALLTNALDASKLALVDTENRLDESLARASSAEAALLGIGDTREAMRRARETTQDAEAELQRVTSLLVQQRERFQEVAEEKGKTVEKREEFENAIKEREREVEKLRLQVAEAQATEQEIEASYEAREEELKAEMEQKEQELETVRAERVRAEEQAIDLEARAATVAEQAEAAEYALGETKRELERVQHDLEARQKERELVDAESALAHKRSKETLKLRHMITDMERKLHELQAELRDRDQVVNEFAMESDELRSLLAARDVELREVSSRLESAMTAEVERGGDSTLSEMSLKEVQKNLDAEKLALSAEISKAELASFDLTEDDLDPLDRIKKEVGAEEDLIQAGLRKAESAVRLEELRGARKEDAVGDVLKSIDKDGEEGVGSEELKDGEQEVISSGLDKTEELVGDVGVESMVAKQAQTKTEEGEAKPKKRRGRASKNSSAGTAASGDKTTEGKPRKKRGRPRKKDLGES